MKKSIKEQSRAIVEQKKIEQQLRREREAENRKRKAENAKKSEVVQVVSGFGNVYLQFVEKKRNTDFNYYG